MNNRLRKIRNHYELSQEEFGNKIMIKRSHVSSLENGTRAITDRVIIDICREFNVNEEWLRSGTGEMFIKLDRDIELTTWASKITRSDYDIPFARKFVHMLSQLDKDDWKAIEKMAIMLSEGKKED